MKKVLVIRLGAYGDAIFCTKLLKALKEDGYHVTMNCNEQTKKILLHDQNIDAWINHKTDSVPMEKLDEHWIEIGKGFDKVVNLSGSIEQKLLKLEGTDEYKWSKEKRHEECNINYYDYTLELGGYGHIKGENGQLYFTKAEHKWAKKEIAKCKGKFTIIWALSGSSFHKTYPYTEYVACEFLDKYLDSIMFTVGEPLCQVLEWDHPRTKCKSGKWTIRQSMLMTKYADLVIGTETGLLNAAACYDTPKIVMLSHSTHENLSKHWKNTFAIHADVDCYPCHQLHYTREACPLDKKTGAPICTARLDPIKVLRVMEEIYCNRRTN